MNRKLYQHLASRVQAMENCRMAGNSEWLDRHRAVIDRMVGSYMPRGSGFDAGTVLHIGKSSANKLVFSTAYHHMHESGMYDGWSEHIVIVTPDLASGFNLKVTGRDRNDIKDYIGEAFHYALSLDFSDEAVAAAA